MTTLILIWLATGAALVLLGSQKLQASAGLPLAYFLGLSLIHVPGAFLYIDLARADGGLGITEVGFEQTVIGMVSFLIGVVIANTRAFRLGRRSSAKLQQEIISGPSHDANAINRLAMSYIVFGGLSYFVLLPIAGNVPSLTSLVSALGSMIIVGFFLRFWLARETGDRFKFWVTVGALPLLPLMTVVQGGFIVFGIYWILAIVAFTFYQSKHRVRYYLLVPFVIFVGMSVFVNYLAARTDLRRLVWYQQADFIDRIDRVATMFEEFEWFDSSNPTHRMMVNLRLNQNILVGLVVRRLESGAVEYSNGSTIIAIAVALVPRVIWPDKPAVGGGGDVVRYYTGVEFARNTSVGAGQVLEFYVNFGTYGVIGGFILFGLLLGTFDRRAIEALHRRDQRSFLLWSAIGLAMLQPGGNLLEIVISSVSSAVTAYGVSHYFMKRWTLRPT